MLSRSVGANSSPRPAANVGSPLSSKLRRMAVWISSSVGTADLIACNTHQHVGMVRFFDQDIERWNVLVPFDQGRHRAEPAQCPLVERPHLADHARGVVIDPQSAAIGKLPNAVAGKMDFTDRIRRQRS